MLTNLCLPAKIRSIQLVKLYHHLTVNVVLTDRGPYLVVASVARLLGHRGVAAPGTGACL